MRWWHIIIILIIVGLISLGIFNLSQENKIIGIEAEKFRAELQTLTKRKETVQDRINYLQDPENLEKEIKTQLNYRNPDEKLIIVVPETEVTE